MEDRYEHIDILIKTPVEGDSWFDRIFDLVTSECQGTPYNEETDEDGDPCTCGMESMGGSSGTLDQCYEHMRITEKWAQDVLTDDLKLILEAFDHAPWIDGFGTSEMNRVQEAYERLRKAAYWHDDFNEWVANLPDEEDNDDED